MKSSFISNITNSIKFIKECKKDKDFSKIELKVDGLKKIIGELLFSRDSISLLDDNEFKELFIDSEETQQDLIRDADNIIKKVNALLINNLIIKSPNLSLKQAANLRKILTIAPSLIEVMPELIQGKAGEGLIGALSKLSPEAIVAITNNASIFGSKANASDKKDILNELNVDPPEKAARIIEILSQLSNHAINTQEKCLFISDLAQASEATLTTLGAAKLFNGLSPKKQTQLLSILIKAPLLIKQMPELLIKDINRRTLINHLYKLSTNAIIAIENNASTFFGPNANALDKRFILRELEASPEKAADIIEILSQLSDDSINAQERCLFISDLAQASHETFATLVPAFAEFPIFALKFRDMVGSKRVETIEALAKSSPEKVKMTMIKLAFPELFHDLNSIQESKLREILTKAPWLIKLMPALNDEKARDGLIKTFPKISTETISALKEFASKLNDKMEDTKKAEIIKIMILFSPEMWESLIFTQKGEPIITTKGKGKVSEFLEVDKENFLGKGISGKVYAIKSEKNDLAVKKSIDKTTIKDSYIDEFKISDKIHHQNIAKSYKLYLKKYSDGTYRNYIVMDKVKGISILSLMSDGNKIQHDYTRKLIKQAESCCLYLFEKKIIWRDLHENNIFIDDNGLKILDFGAWYEEKNRDFRVAYKLILGSKDLLKIILEVSSIPEEIKSGINLFSENYVNTKIDKLMNLKEEELTTIITNYFDEVLAQFNKHVNIEKT